MHVLKTFNLLPVIFFLKSRSDCNFAVSSCHRHILAGHRSEAIEARLHELLADFPFLEGHAQTRNLIHHGLGSHHGGQLPHWKIIVEKLMNEGLLDAMFSTSTVAAGVNFPARSVVMVQSDRFNGKEFVSLSSTELHQAIGRAGRRGKDKIGFALMAHGPFQDPHLIARLLKKDPEAIESQIKINFSMCLNLLLSQTPDEVFKLLNDSFATFQRAASVRDLEERYNDSNEELDRLTEGARCQDANQMAELITKRSDGYKRLSALISKKKKYVKQCARAQADISEDGYIKHAAAEIADLSRELKNLPCKGCPCFTFCHQGKKKSHSGKLVLKTNELQAQLEHARSYLRIEFTRHLDFLILNGFATETGALTEDGLWASKLRLDQPLIIAELIRKNKFSSMTPEMLAAMIAVFVNDKYRDLELDTSISWSKKDVMGVYDQLKDAIQDLTRKKEEHNFKLPVLQFWPAAALYTWASGEGWEGVIRLTAVDEGDLAMLIFRTADNLRQLTSLEKTHPELAAKAHQSIRLLLREPVIIPL
ncbi:MAG: hypothetical protein GY868_07040 [Deltaproteobacteria bacterium]|nr:hypothetical protein [Deltaproteobacteria bacterium]